MKDWREPEGALQVPPGHGLPGFVCENRGRRCDFSSGSYLMQAAETHVVVASSAK